MPTETKNTEQKFRDGLRNLLRRDGLSQAQAARNIGIHPSQLSLYLSGKADVHSGLLLKLLKSNGIDLSVIIEQAMRPAKSNARVDFDEMTRLFRRLSPLEQKNTDRMLRRMLQLKGKA